MSKLFDDASLAMIPSAYKDGKLYSIRPTDGSGDFTFSRGSNLAATRVDVNGLIEKGRENLLTYSNDFSQWTNSSSIETSGQSGYDGSNDAWLLTATGTSNSILLRNVSASGVQTLTIYAKANTAQFVSVLGIGSSVNPYSYFDLGSGTLGTSADTIDRSITSIGNGWYRCSITFTENIIQARFYVTDGDGSSAVTIGNSIYIQDAQLEAGLVATDYIETGASTAQAGILEDMPRLDYSGSCPALLLEPQRTNVAPDSEYFDAWVKAGCSVTTNAAISPEGVQNASKIVEDTSTGLHLVARSNLYQEGQDNYLTIYAKEGERRYLAISSRGTFTNNDNTLIFDTRDGVWVLNSSAQNEGQDAEDVGNGWWRVKILNTSASAAYDGFGVGIATSFDNWSGASYTGDGSSGIYIWGAQIESGASYPTSYIPTYGSSVTRSFDNAGTRTDMQDFLGTDTGAWFMHLDEFYFDVTGTGLGAIILAENGQQATSIELVQDGQFQYKITLDNSTAVENLDGEDKLLLNWSDEFFKIFVNGVNVYSAASGTRSHPFTHLILPQTTRAPHIKIKQMAFFPTALTDSECIALTTI